MRDWLLRRYGLVSAAVCAVGIALILVAEFGHVDWTRVFGALAITAGGVGVGTWFGLAAPRRWPLQARLRDWRRAVAIVVAVVLSAPAVVGLGAAIVGLADDAGRSARGVTVGVGAVIAIGFGIATLVALALSVGAIDRAARGVRRGHDDGDGHAA